MRGLRETMKSRQCWGTTMENLAVSKVTFHPEVLQPSSHLKTNTEKEDEWKKRHEESNAGVPVDGESEAKRLTDFKGAQRDLLPFVWSLLTHFAMEGNRNWLTLGSCGMPTATSQQWNVILSAMAVHSDCCCCLAVEESVLGLRVLHPKESRFHIREWNAFWHSSTSPWFE